jgi:hypothetical protein
VARVLSAVGVKPTTLGRSLFLLNVKDVNPRTSTGSIPWKMAEKLSVLEE